MNDLIESDPETPGRIVFDNQRTKILQLDAKGFTHMLYTVDTDFKTAGYVPVRVGLLFSVRDHSVDPGQANTIPSFRMCYAWRYGGSYEER